MRHTMRVAAAHSARLTADGATATADKQQHDDKQHNADVATAGSDDFLMR
jgi:hypothetical protein